ncbi:MAG TPA: sulfurtransferase, partial [Burkholderiaceae bacterium]|nr:sulfurtransferase [Burkholderiaceae bacterium]
TFVSADKAREIARTELNQSTEETISFCNTGHWAATDWFALSEVVGQPNVRLYPASLAEWTQASTPLPMDHVPSRGQQLVNQLKGLFGSS